MNIAKITVFFANGTTVEIHRPTALKTDPSAGLLLVSDEKGDDYLFIMQAIKYWIIKKTKVIN
jgi:hypothetical protein